MAKTLIILVLLFDGTLIKETLDFAKPVTIHECMMFADDHRTAISTYNEKQNTWLLNDGRGTLQGFICD
jgi:hypothetical protein|tara:strand:- start:2011 stop:2217 length:207 start_codon:yes stop_codon:yes gene_type:complete